MKLIGIIFLIVLAIMSGVEWLNFRRAATGDGMAYPRRRLSRRIGIGLLLAAAIAMATFVPAIHPWFDLGLLVFVALLIAVALKLLVRELRESSEAAAAYAVEVNRLSRASMEELMRQAEAAKREQSKAEPRGD